MPDLDAIRARDAGEWQYVGVIIEARRQRAPSIGLDENLQAHQDRHDLLAALDAALARERRLREAAKSMVETVLWDGGPVWPGGPRRRMSLAALQEAGLRLRAALAETPEATDG